MFDPPHSVRIYEMILNIVRVRDAGLDLSSVIAWRENAPLQVERRIFAIARN